ncbi:MAG: helix-turn-helix domain-containing protein [Treponema sp.]|jgi:hypothetical protein|nr:helix-turn-helix domain-containing protein [Treponema sp.]
MNIFGKSLEEIQADPLPEDRFDLLPGVPETISLKDTASIFGVSPQTVERMIAKGDLALTPSGILKSELVAYISTHTLADLPVMDI